MLPSSFTNVPDLTKMVIQGEKTENDSNNKSPTTDGDSMLLRQTWHSRIDTAKQLISGKPDESKFVIQNLANIFNIFTNTEQSGEMSANQKEFLALLLSQCNLADVSCLEALNEVFSLHKEISGELPPTNQRSPTEAKAEAETELKTTLNKLANVSRNDSKTKQGDRSMAVERQGFVESEIKTKFANETQQQIKDTLVLLKYQITSGNDIGPIPDEIASLNNENPESIKKFAIHCKYPNNEIFSENRSVYENKINEFNNISDDCINKLTDKLKEMKKNTKEDSTPPQKAFNDEEIDLIKKNLHKPIADMPKEALLLASFAPALPPEMRDYLKSCHILALKTEEAKHQESKSPQSLLAKALLDSDETKRALIACEGFETAPKHAATELIKMLTPLEGIPV